MGNVYHRIEDVPEWIRPFIEERTIKSIDVRTNKNVEYKYFGKLPIPINEMLIHENELNKHLKWDVSGTCYSCGNHFVTTWNSLLARKKHAKEEFCGKCLRKEQFTEEWRRHNSEAQKKVQGTPEARRKMSEILKEVHRKDPEIRKRIGESLRRGYKEHPERREKVSEDLRKRWKDAEGQQKFMGRGFYYGWVFTRCGRIFFASSWELMFLLWCDNNIEVCSFKRCTDHVPYKTILGKPSNYYPDFEMEIGGTQYVVEIKGNLSEFETVQRKKEAAESFYFGNKRYIILYKADLERMGILKYNKKVELWISELCDSNKIECCGFGKFKNTKSFENYLANKLSERKEKQRIKEEKKHKMRLDVKCPELLLQWNYNKNDKGPDFYPYWSSEKAWWICSDCGNEWKQTISSRTCTPIRNSCPVCAKKRLRKEMSERSKRMSLIRFGQKNLEEERLKYINEIKRQISETGIVPTREEFLMKSKMSFVYLYKIFGAYNLLVEESGFTPRKRKRE
ncbi:MAG: zinc-ribbon domain-containing protein [Candidatus Methanomethylophilaceae archaeon]